MLHYQLWAEGYTGCLSPAVNPIGVKLKVLSVVGHVSYFSSDQLKTGYSNSNPYKICVPKMPGTWNWERVPICEKYI